MPAPTNPCPAATVSVVPSVCVRPKVLTAAKPKDAGVNRAGTIKRVLLPILRVTLPRFSQVPLERSTIPLPTTVAGNAAGEGSLVLKAVHIKAAAAKEITAAPGDAQNELTFVPRVCWNNPVPIKPLPTYWTPAVNWAACR